MPFANRNTFITAILILLLCVSTAAKIGLVTLTPPQILNIDQRNVFYTLDAVFSYQA
ncbi:MAG: hypothetical protein ACI88A_003168 [Paraglaciecola sp.]|jgi:hypothetical protein